MKTPSRAVVVTRYAKLLSLVARPETPVSIMPVSEVPVAVANSAVPALKWVPVGANSDEWRGDVHALVYFKDLGVRLVWMVPLIPILGRHPWKQTLAQVLLESHLDGFSEIVTRIYPARYEALVKGPRPVSHRVRLYEKNGIWQIRFGIHISAVGEAVTNQAIEDTIY